MRLSKIRINKIRPSDARYVNASGVRGMEIFNRPMYAAHSPSVAELRGERHKSMHTVERKFFSFLGRYGPYLCARTYNRAEKQYGSLHKKKLPVGYLQKTGKQQKNEYSFANAVGRNDRSRSRRQSRDKSNNPLLSNSAQSTQSSFVRKTGCNEPVYDILNCGPRHRFAVMGDAGPMIVHNCVQAIARDLLGEKLFLISKTFKIAFHVHDEIIAELETFKPPHLDMKVREIEMLMAKPVSWAPGLPLSADAYASPYYYKKD